MNEFPIKLALIGMISNGKTNTSFHWMAFCINTKLALFTHSASQSMVSHGVAIAIQLMIFSNDFIWPFECGKQNYCDQRTLHSMECEWCNILNRCVANLCKASLRLCWFKENIRKKHMLVSKEEPTANSQHPSVSLSVATLYWSRHQFGCVCVCVCL